MMTPTVHPSFHSPCPQSCSPTDRNARPNACRFENEYGCPVDCSDSPNLDVSSSVVSFQILKRVGGCQASD